MPHPAEDQTTADGLAGCALLQALGAELVEADHGYVEIAAPAAGAADGAQIGAGAIAALAEAAARLALGPAATTEAFSLHLQGPAPLSGAARLIARGELLRAEAGRARAAAQADVFRVDETGGEALLASALVTLSPA